ncbi:hypothetical protein DFH06DRAFT_1165785 [Mycena polygramma]|nr:hypothetical protein DFH06DRAFT_1165785 [Mycena polygramma]
MSRSSLSSSHCSAMCPIHIASTPWKSPDSPLYPEVVLSSEAVPSDNQAKEIHSVIEGVEEDIQGLDGQIAQLQRALDEVLRRRAELKSFVENHYSAVSVVRRLPAETLSEIFLHCVDACVHSDPTKMPRPTIQVCRRWRAVALAFPQLWRHFVIRGNFHGIERIPLELKRSGDVPLSITVGGHPFLPVLPLLLSVSRRWQSVYLIPDQSQLTQLLTSTYDFPILKKLAVEDCTWSPLNWPLADIIRFCKALPALEELSLQTASRHPIHQVFPWSRLRRCELSCNVDDMLRILPQFSPGTHVSLRKINNAGRPASIASPIRIAIHTLELFDFALEFLEDVLGSVIAPSLKELTLMTPWISDNVGLIITSFLRRSSCTLTSLSLGFPTLSPDLPSILGSLHLQGIVHLRLDFPATFSYQSPLTRMLARRDLVPDLRVLAFVGHMGLTEEDLLKIVTSRRPVLRELRIESRKNRVAHSVLSPTAVDGLIAEGLEVTFTEYMSDDVCNFLTSKY